MESRKWILAICAGLSLALLLGQAVAASPQGAVAKTAPIDKEAAGPLSLTPTAVAPALPGGQAAAPLAPLVVLYDQSDNVTTYGASSQNFETTDDAYDDQAADDFVVSGSGWTVTTLVVPGFYSASGGPVVTFHVTFFQDAAGIPGTAVCDYPALAYVDSPTGTYTMTLSPGCVLTPGTKWVSVQANMDYATGGQWYWYQRTVQSNSPGQWQNPGGGFGAGCLTWGPLTTCLSSTYPDLAFTLSGTVNSCNTDPDCSDGNLCNGVEQCVSGTCVPGTPVNCNDNLFCTLDICNPQTGACSYAPNPCDDSDSCTADTCNEDTDTCSHQAVCLQFCNTANVDIPALPNTSGIASPYPTTITVSGAGALANVSSVQLKCMTHSYPDDIDMLLVGPLGQNAIIMSDVGGSYGLACVSLTLSDSAAASLPDSAQITSGTYKPTNIGTGDTFAAPAPTPSGGSALSVFNALNPNGDWKLYIVDDASGDSGPMSQGWCLNIAVLSCTSNADCTDDTCVNTQCTHSFNTNPCNDNNACTTGEVCANGACGGGTPTDCNDHDACTTDTCNTQTGACGHTAVVCDDLLPCTANLCDPQGGCYYPNDDNLPCTDNNLCTADHCANGVCVSTPSVDCSNAPMCNTGACNPTTGQCVYTPSPGQTCNDGNLCTTNDVCTCAPGGLSENFDGVTVPNLPAGWTSLAAGAWTTVNTVSDTPPNSAFVVDPATVTDQSLITPQFTGVGGGQLTFRHEYTFEGVSYCWDGGVLEISINGGAFQDILAAGGSFVTGGYNGTVYTGYSNPLAGRAAWCFNTSSAFITTTLTLPAAAQGQPVQLKWRFGSDSSGSGTGWYVDTISLPVCNIGCVGTPLTCTALDQCHVAGTCDSQTGNCSNPSASNGTSCNDGNVCTTQDVCLNGVCNGGPHVPPPPEINNSVTVQLLGGGGGGRISWSDAPGPYNVYRGYRSGTWVYNHTCFDPGTSGPSTDTALPVAGETFYYLVSRKDPCGESIVGRNSAGVPDPNPTPCP